jgi:sterol desaturase/sphingolipid hydroxylase (fatty acid hydroxylase superfamily)
MGEWNFGGTNFGWPTALLLVMVALFARSFTIIGLASLWVKFSRFAQRHRVYRLAIRRKQVLSEIRAGVLVIVTDGTIVFFSLMFGIVTLQTNPGPAITAFSFLTAFLWAEIWFYAIHRALHNRRLYWIHRQHHVAKVSNPLTAISFSVIERLIFVGGLVGFLGLVSRAMHEFG